MFFEIYKSILTTILSFIIGIDLKDFKNSLNKKKYENLGDIEISENIDKVSKKLEESKEIIENALIEMAKQKELYEQMKKDAELSQQISTMNKEQISALNEVLEKTLSKQDKKSFPKNQFWNLFYCILSALLGFILGKIF